MNIQFLRDQTFLRNMLGLAVPVAVQQFLVAGLNMVDVVMVGQLGEASIAALGLANQVPTEAKPFVASAVCSEE